MTNNSELSQLQTLCHESIQTIFQHYLSHIPALELKMAMQDSLSNTGKLLRPMLIYATGHIFNASDANLAIPAAAVEMMHTYSLIHDDLPCMDDADLRRGKPACHKAHGETMAVLAGDALNTLAFEVIADYPGTLTPQQRLQMVQTLSQASGPLGMVAGQTMDITLLGQNNPSSETIETTHKLKTGAIFKACIELGRLAAGNDDDHDRDNLSQFGDAIGLAFQIQDDLLDELSSSEQLGKPQSLDLQNNKSTYSKTNGITKTKERINELYQNALETLNVYGHKAQELRTLCKMMMRRDS